MAIEAPVRRVPDDSMPHGGDGRRPTPVLVALLTVAALLAIFGTTFVIHPGRPAPAHDPAYYTWRTELLLAEGPRAMLEATGPQQMFSSGYRIAANVLGGLMRHLAGVAPMTWTVWLMVGLRVLIPVLLAGLVYRYRRDPLAVPVVALSAAPLMLTPPLGGYVDNVLALFFLSAAAFFIEPARRSWTARLALGGLLLTSGFTHPTTLAIFCVVLGAMAVVRWLFRGFALRSVVRDDGPALATAFVAVVLTYLAWKFGIWGPSASLGDAALPPPADAEFFWTRLGGWVRALRPALNGPLLLLGLGSMFVFGRRWVEDGLSRLSVIWLLPLAGLFGFAVDLTYPYYRFLNTTPAWVLLIGVGTLVAMRFFVHRARAKSKLYWLGVASLVLLVATNLISGYSHVAWNDPESSWIALAKRRDLDALRAALATQDGPVVFTVSTTATAPERVWGAVKRAGNQSRYGVPGPLLDQTFVCLGSPASCASGEAAGEPGSYHSELSVATVEDLERGLGGRTREVLYVKAAAFNKDERLELPESGDVWSVRAGSVVDARTGETIRSIPATSEPSPMRPLWAGLGLAAMMLPGWFVLRRVLPGASLIEAIGLVPALASALLVLCGTAVLALSRTPFERTAAVGTLALAAVAGLSILISARREEAAE